MRDLPDLRITDSPPTGRNWSIRHPTTSGKYATIRSADVGSCPGSQAFQYPNVVTPAIIKSDIAAEKTSRLRSEAVERLDVDWGCGSTASGLNRA
jgi:hypothetical protein